MPHRHVGVTLDESIPAAVLNLNADAGRDVGTVVGENLGGSGRAGARGRMHPPSSVAQRVIVVGKDGGEVLYLHDLANESR